MMRLFVVIMACAVSSCATPHKPNCPPLPLMQQAQTLKDYTLQIITLYDECAKS